MSKKEIVFWACFVLLNALLFVPKFLVDLQTSTLFPQFLSQDSFSDQLKYFFRRENNDPFRISIDFFLLTCLLLGFRKIVLKTKSVILITTIYLIWFFYQVYQGVMHTLYSQDALFYNDYFLIIEGWSLLQAEAGWWLAIGVLGFLTLVVAVGYVMNAFIKTIFQLPISRYTKSILVAISILIIVSTVDYRTRLLDDRLVFPIKSYWMVDNMIQSLNIYKSLSSFEPSTFKINHDYKNYSLSEKPNIYLIFIESYGSVLYDNPILQEDYLKLTQDKTKKLSNNGWFAASTLSESPVVGGRSWLSYTSFLLGAKIARHRFYQYFVNNPQYQLPTMFKSLKAEGYHSYWLSVIEDKRGDIPYDDYQTFYGFDEWIKFNDLNYKGKRFGAFYTPPDQYSLNFAHQHIKASDKDPFFLFFISLNSHHPFQTPTTLAENWEVLANQQNQPSNEKQVAIEEAYASSISYQFDYLVDFITNKGTDNDLFILVGDHQPPILSNQYPAKETPVHIISKDSTLISAFYNYGLGPGLYVNDRELKFYHTGFYSMIMRELIANYSQGDNPLPLYLPEGAPWQNSKR